MLSRALQRSWPARIVAIGFIVVVVFGNLWLAMSLLGAATPTWINHGFSIGTTLAMGGGVALGVLAIWRRFSGRVDETVAGGDDGDDRADGGGAP